ncbi:biliverdin-producing heme oxygenase [Hymenobacter coalescens]
MPIATRSDILQQLRRGTHAQHAALEQNQFNQELSAGTVSAEATARFLGKLYGFLVPYEAEIRRHAAEFEPAWELEQRYRASLIREDLPDAEALPLCPALPPLHTRAQLLGALYVMEGSTLGGQLITRQLAKAGISTRRYFTGYGELTGLRWKAFCQLLAAEATEANEADIVAAAVLTFERLHAWIEQP